MTARVGIVPYNARPGRGLAGLALATLDWPLGAPDLPGTATIADLGPDDHVLVFPNTRLHLARWGRIRAKVSLFIAEPDAIHAKHIRLLTLSHRRFHRILTRSPQALRRFANARRFVAGDTFLATPDQPAGDKTREVSLIASAKRDQTGHRLRHELVERIRATGRDVDIMGRGYAPFEAKEDGLAPYRYSLVIENVREPSYFTEKIVDACLCRTVPIYWGAPDIGQWFDMAGVIECTSLDELDAALGRISPQDYAARAAAIDTNRGLALNYADMKTRAARVLLTDRGETPPCP